MVFGQRAEGQSSEMVDLFRFKGNDFHAGGNERAQALKLVSQECSRSSGVPGMFQKQRRDQWGWSQGGEGDTAGGGRW